VSPAGGPGSGEADAWQVLLDEGLLDQDFYAAQTGRSFDSPEQAAQHLQASGLRLGLSPHPLVDVATLPDALRKARDAGQLARVLDHLRSPQGLARPWSPLFDPARAVGVQGGTPTWPAVRDWLARLRPDVELPVPDPGRRRVTFGEARADLLAHARQLADDRRRHRRPRTTRTWDVEAEVTWLAEVARAPLPADEPLVSVVMPVWNRADRVREAIASVQAQDLDAWELVAVDDGSTDDSVTVLRELAAADPRIVVVEAPHGGVSRARNAGLERARGRYVAFLDSDNTWRPLFLSTMVRAMARDGLGAAYAGLSVRSADGLQFRAFDGGLEQLMMHNHIDLNVLLVEAEVARAVGGFDAELRRWVDHDYVLRVAQVSEPRLLPFLGCDYDDSADASEGPADADRITLREPDNWQFAVLDKAWVDWDTAAERLGERVAGRTSVVVVARHDVRPAVEAAWSAVSTTPDEDVEVVVVDEGLGPAPSMSLRAGLLGVNGVRIERLPRSLRAATAHNIGVVRSTGDTVLLLGQDCVLRPGWRPPLLDRLAEPGVLGVQALVLNQDDTIHSAGFYFPVADALPVPVAAGHPRGDAEALRQEGLTAASRAALLVRAADLVALRGFDARFVGTLDDVDLALRSRVRLGGRFAVEPQAVATRSAPAEQQRSPYLTPSRRLFLERWRGALPADGDRVHAALGLRMVGVGLDGDPSPAPVPVLVRAGADGLRWGVLSPVAAGPDGDDAELTRLCESLAAALRTAGQGAAVVRVEAQHGPASRYDDVAVCVRSGGRVDPEPGRVNVLWDLGGGRLPARELAGFDVVAASTPERVAEIARLTGGEVLLLTRDLAGLTDVRAAVASVRGS
jgi:glycosyltransferase involved in cell wall biosynthesis